MIPIRPPRLLCFNQGKFLVIMDLEVAVKQTDPRPLDEKLYTLYGKDYGGYVYDHSWTMRIAENWKEILRDTEGNGILGIIKLMSSSREEDTFEDFF